LPDDAMKSNVPDVVVRVAARLPECTARLILAGVWMAGALLVLGFWVFCLGAFIVLLTRAR
jgi:hypothetical protein